MGNLADVVRGSRELGYLLPSKVVACLDASGDEAFADDAEYMRFVQARVVVGHEAWAVRQGLRRAVSELESSECAMEMGADLALKLDELGAGLDGLMARRLERHEGGKLAPRAVRLARRLGLTAAEQRLLLLLVVRATGVGEVGGLFRIGWETLAELGAQAGMASGEMVEFIREERTHMEQGLVEASRSTASSVFQSPMLVQDELVRVLSGAMLTPEECLRVGGTALADVLAEEPAFAGRFEASDDEVAEDCGSSGPEDDEGASPASEDHGEVQDEELHGFIRDEVARSRNGAARPAENGAEDEGGEPDGAAGAEAAVEGALQPYRADLEYLEDQFEYLAAKVELLNAERHGQDDGTGPDRRRPGAIRAIRGRERMLRNKVAKRLELTRREGAWLPRLERLAEVRRLDAFERFVLLCLVAEKISSRVKSVAQCQGGLDKVKTLMVVWGGSLSEQVEQRRYFYKSARLVREGMIFLGTRMADDLSMQDVEIDRRILDFVVGLDTESDELVEGSHLFTPTVSVEQVILPAGQKQLILDTVSTYEKFVAARKELGFDEVVQLGRALVMMFFGPSGTGKTMMANALARHLGKRVLLINFPSLGRGGDETMKWIFREARIQDAIVFFDECESIFKSRDFGNNSVSLLLTEIERHDGLVIMATNRPFDLDEAMHRRITLALEFKQPGPDLRERIWRNHVPAKVPFDGEVDYGELAMRFELSGGFIRNAVLTALSIAAAREGATITLRHDDFVEGAKLQLRSRLRMIEFDRRVAPTRGLDAVVVDEPLRRRLLELVGFEKARTVLFGEWGFDDMVGRGEGTAALFYGPPGTGKSLSIEAVGYEIGRPLKVVNCAELRSKYVGETATNIEALFKDAQQNDSIVVFDEAEGLFGTRGAGSDAATRDDTLSTGVLLYHVEKFAGMVILVTNLIDFIDPAFMRRMKFVLEFSRPDRATRAELWRHLIPAAVPLSDDVAFDDLAERFEMTGGTIKNAIYRAAARAVLRQGDERRVSHRDLVEAATEETRRSAKPRVGFQAQA